MSCKCSPHPGDMILYRGGPGYRIGAVDISRPGSVTVFPWQHLARDWARARARVPAHSIVRILPPSTAPAALSDQLNALHNQREADRMAAFARFEQRVLRLVTQLEPQS